MKKGAAHKQAKLIVDSLLNKSPELAREVALQLSQGKLYLGPWFMQGAKHHRLVLDGWLVAATVQPFEQTWTGYALSIGDSGNTVGDLPPIAKISGGSHLEVMAAIDAGLRELGVVLLEDPSYLPASHRPKILTEWQKPDPEKWVRKDAATGEVKAIVSLSHRKYTWKAWPSSGQLSTATSIAKTFQDHEEALKAAWEGCDAVLAAEGWVFVRTPK